MSVATGNKRWMNSRFMQEVAKTLGGREGGCNYIYQRPIIFKVEFNCNKFVVTVLFVNCSNLSVFHFNSLPGIKK